MTLKRVLVILLCVCVGAAAASAVWLAAVMPWQRDISGVYVPYVIRALDAVKLEPVMFDPLLESGIVYLDTSKVSSTSCDHLIAQMRIEVESRGMTLETCSKEEAAEKGLISTNGIYSQALNCIWLTVGDEQVSDTQILGSVCNYVGALGAYGYDFSLDLVDGNWLITQTGGGIS